MARPSTEFLPTLALDKITSNADHMEWRERDGIRKLVLPVCAQLFVGETTASKSVAIIVDVERVATYASPKKRRVAPVRRDTFPGKMFFK